jgi:hypothetical protein
MTKFEAVLAALLERDRDNVCSSDLKNMVKAEFLGGAATAFALCWRGEESSQCLEAAKGLHDQLEPPTGGHAGRPHPYLAPSSLVPRRPGGGR